MEDSEVFAFIATIIVLIIVLVIAFCSCDSDAQTPPQEEEKTWIHMSDGDSLELVSDDYGNQYLKERTIHSDWYIYIPYPGDTQDGSDTLKFYNAKN